MGNYLVNEYQHKYGLQILQSLSCSTPQDYIDLNGYLPLEVHQELGLETFASCVYLMESLEKLMDISKHRIKCIIIQVS